MRDRFWAAFLHIEIRGILQKMFELVLFNC